MPTDLKYLSVIESGLKPSATSRSGAAGLWQFMKPTGKMLGLKINSTVDERRDIEKSTRAAADYLKQLYDRFDDWTLAIAAYNCGPGNLRKAIRKSGGKTTYWEIQQYLPRETREYVPKFIAMSYMMNYYYEHDLIPALVGEELVNTSSAKVFEKMNLKNLSSELSIDFEVVKTLNPSYVTNYIPHTVDGKYNLVLPTPEMRIVATKYHVLAALPKLDERKNVEEEPTVDETKTRSFISMPRPIGNILSTKNKNLPKVHSIQVHPISIDDRYIRFRPKEIRNRKRK